MDDEYKIGLDISEENYRDLPYPSYSLLSDIAKNGGEVVNGKRNEDINEMDGVMVGKLVDNLITENKYPDNFYVVKKIPTGKAKDVLKVLSKNIKYLKNKTDLFHEDNHEIIDKCCDIIKYHKHSKTRSLEETKDKRLKGLINYKEYSDILIKAPENSFIMSEYLKYQADRCVKQLKNNFPEYFVKESIGKNILIIPQVKLLGEFNKTKIKGMLDFVIVDHDNLTITPVDLKTGHYDSSKFFEEGYLGWNYYIQSALYKSLLEDEIKKHDLYSFYKVKDFMFIFCSRLRFNTTTMLVTRSMQENAIKGFKIGLNDYPGVNELINTYNYYKIK